MRCSARARAGFSVVAAVLIAGVLLWVPAIGGDVPVAHAIPTLQPVPTLQPFPAAIVNIYAAGYPKQPDGSTIFEFWVYNTGSLDASNVKVHTWYYVHSKAGPFTQEIHTYIVLPKVKAGDSEPVQVPCYASSPLYCASAVAQIEPTGGYVIAKGHDVASLTIPQ